MKTKKAIILAGVLCFIVGNGFVGGAQTASLNDMVVRHAKRMCNKNFYETFSQDGRDFVEFWLTANEVKLDLEKAYSCMRLFYNNCKSCHVVDYTVVDQVSKVLPQLFEKYFENEVNPDGQFKIIRGNVEDLMLDRFTDRYDSFQSQPDLFISKMSSDITKLVKSRLAVIKEEEEERELKEKFRSLIIRFLDTSIGKAIWYEESYRSIWPSFLSIADNLHTIGKRSIINDQDNLDELWDSLVRRFVWYLDFNGSALPVEFYEQIEEDLKNNTVFFLEVDEQDEGIRTKKDMIAQAVIAAKTKAIAYELQGVMSDQDIKIG
ncbi:hypothetical protein KKA53_00975 [Candidatus Dependentiae bacterium]|nr:hypothetical protein [Candidatus Dependentiae bacterium]